MPEAGNTFFIMHGARDAIAGGLAHIEQQVISIEKAVVENPGLSFDLAKTLIESTCKAILKERTIRFNEDDDLPKLFKVVSTSLPFLPPAVSAEAGVRESIRKTLGGLHTAVQGICELRGRCGFASHGSSEARPAMELEQAILVAQTADTIVGFLYRVHRYERVTPQTTSSLYDGNTKFNEYTDEIHEIVKIFDAEFLPSKVLFELEPETYRIHLAEYDIENNDAEQTNPLGAPR